MPDLSFVQLIVPAERKLVLIVHSFLEDQLCVPLRAQGKTLRSFPEDFYFPLRQEQEERKIATFSPTPSSPPKTKTIEL